MKAHWNYLRYVLRHKWFVYQEGRKLGLGRWQLFIHDWQKFTPTEWFPYVEKFFGNKPSPRRSDGGYDPTAQGDDFTRAWHHHVHYGPHHWQYWCLPTDAGGLTCLPIPRKYRKEMLADWRGAGRAQGKGDDLLVWYSANRDKMHMHSETQKWFDYETGWMKQQTQNKIDNHLRWERQQGIS